MRSLLALLFAATIGTHATPAAEAPPATDKSSPPNEAKTRETAPRIKLPDALPADFDGSIPIANHHVDRTLDQVIFTWKLFKYPPAGEDGARFTSAVGKVHLPDFKPQSEGILKLDLPAIFKDADALQILVNEFNSQLITSRTWPLKDRKALLHAPTSPPTDPPVELLGNEPIRVRCDNTVFSFSSTTGQLSGVTINGRESGLANGPRRVVKPAGATPSSPISNQATVSLLPATKQIVIDTQFGDEQNKFRWIVHPGGRLQLDYRFALPPGTYHHAGVGFDLPTTKMTSKRWLGPGPEFGLWKNTPGDDDFHGYFRDIVWMTLGLTHDALTLIPSKPDTIVGLLLPPRERTPSPAHRTAPASGGLFFFDEIPPGPTEHDGQLTGSMVFQFPPGRNAPSSPPDPR